MHVCVCSNHITIYIYIFTLGKHSGKYIEIAHDHFDIYIYTCLGNGSGDNMLYISCHA